jgi:hypothetical protein
VAGWPDFVGIVKASSHGGGGVINEELSWLANIKADIKSLQNITVSITNLDLKMVGSLLLWLVMKEVCGTLQEKQVALFSNNWCGYLN